jgi:GNAT superfamily N-acetyltransferase
MASAATTTIVQKAVADDLDQISVTLSRAFHDDPVMAFIIPDADRRRAILADMLRPFMAAFVRHDETLVTSDGVGAALWAPPGVPPVADHEAEQFGAELEQVLGIDAPRLFAVDQVMAEHHPHTPCFYLQLVGVDPDWQGHGIGSALMAPVLDRCDRAGVPAYLEATSPDNKRLYERHGFHTQTTLQVPGGHPCGPCGASRPPDLPHIPPGRSGGGRAKRSARSADPSGLALYRNKQVRSSAAASTTCSAQRVARWW